MEAGMMTVVVNPTYWTGNLLGHSIGRCAIATAKALSMLPNTHVILPVPENRKLWVYTEEDLAGIDEVLPVAYMNKFNTHMATEDWWSHFNVSSGDVYYDVMLEFNAKIALQMQNWAMAGNYRTKFFLPANPTIVSVVRPAAFVYELGGRLHSRMLEALALSTMPTVFLTEYQREEAIREARQYVAASLLRDVGSRTAVVPHSIDVTNIKYTPRSKPSKVRLMFGTTLSTDKQADKIGAMFQNMQRIGKPVETVVSLPCRKEEDMPDLGKAAVKTFGASAEIHIGPKRAEFEQLLMGADVFACMSTEESFGISFFEQLQAGQVGVYLNRPWLRAVLPAEYPFICETDDEVFARLLWVVDNLEEAQQRVAFMKSWIPEHLSSLAIAEQLDVFLRGQFHDALDADAVVMQQQWLYKLLQTLCTGERYSMADVAKLLIEQKINIFAKSTMYGHSVRRMLQLQGFEALPDPKESVMFVRRCQEC